MCSPVYTSLVNIFKYFHLSSLTSSYVLGVIWELKESHNRDAHVNQILHFIPQLYAGSLIGIRGHLEIHGYIRPIMELLGDNA